MILLETKHTFTIPTMQTNCNSTLFFVFEGNKLITLFTIKLCLRFAMVCIAKKDTSLQCCFQEMEHQSIYQDIIGPNIR